MPNVLLTPLAITRESSRVLHQKLNFIGTVNRSYDDSFAKTGAKIGDSLRIRLPNQYTVRTGAPLVIQDTLESSVTLNVAIQKGVDLNFTSVDLTLSLDDFSKRILDPAMSVLAASIESDALSMTKDVYNLADGDATALTFASIMNGRRILNDNLAPMDSSRSALLSTDHTVKMIDSVKGLFQDSDAIKKQYKEGMIGRTAGFDFYENTLVTDHATGTAAKATGYLSNGVNQIGSVIAIDTGLTTFNKGDIITFAGAIRVHPESKISTGRLQQFVVVNDYAGGAGSITISPAVVATGARRNVTNAIADNSAVTKVGAGASELLNGSMVYHKDAFAFATADLVMPSGIDFASRDTMDGIAMRIIRQYDINQDTFPCRIDILYGFKTIRPELAVRLHADG